MSRAAGTCSGRAQALPSLACPLLRMRPSCHHHELEELPGSVLHAQRTAHQGPHCATIAAAPDPPSTAYALHVDDGGAAALRPSPPINECPLGANAPWAPTNDCLSG